MPGTPSKLQRDAARNIVTKYLKVRGGENAIIESWDHTMPMASAMVDEVRRVGGKVLLVHNDEDAWWRAIDRKQSKLLGKSSAPEWAALKAADIYVNFWGPSDADRIEKLPDKPGNEAFAWNWPWYAVARKTGLRGVRMTAGFVTEGRAKRWGVDLGQWEESLLRASLIDPEEMARSGARLSKALSRGKKVRITHSNGTDLEVALVGVAPRVHDGRPHPWDKRSSPSGMLENIPAGYVDCVLDSKTAEGSIHANRRTNIWWNWHAGAALEFADGKLASYSFEDGEEEFSRQYKNGTAGKNRASALTLGLNPAVKDVPNLEKWERGGASLQIGGNRGLGGTNGSNFFTWFSLASSEIAIDGTPVVRAGKFL
ncbi:MAG: aminopeptidase [Thermoplasmata archaeon]|nr:aminopeptidase [Thermoplasmata archaeon]